MRARVAIVLAGACGGGAGPGGSAEVPVDPDAFRLAGHLLREDDPQGELFGVWGADAADVWVVGGTDDGGVLLRGDAGGLTPETLPAGTPRLRAVAGRGARDVWVGGDQGVLLHWDGRRWHAPAIASATVRGLHLVSSGELLAVGGDDGGPPKAWRWDGLALVDVHLVRAPTSATLLAVGDAGGVALAVGTGGLIVDLGTGRTLPSGRTEDLADVDGRGGVARVVGGATEGFLARLEPDGLVDEATAPSALRAVWDLDDGLVVVAGDRGVQGVYDARSSAFTDVTPTVLQPVHDVWVSVGGDAWTVGGRAADGDGPARGFVAVSPGP